MSCFHPLEIWICGARLPIWADVKYVKVPVSPNDAYHEYLACATCKAESIIHKINLRCYDERLGVADDGVKTISLHDVQ